MKPMSLTTSFPLHAPAASSTSFVKHVDKIVMLKHSQVPNRNKSLQIGSFRKNKVKSLLQIGSFRKNKVFEDQSRGVICYKDENGEIVCEGDDEGPRFQIPGTFYHLRWLQIVKDGGSRNANKGVNDNNKFH